MLPRRYSKRTKINEERKRSGSRSRSTQGRLVSFTHIAPAFPHHCAVPHLPALARARDISSWSYPMTYVKMLHVGWETSKVCTTSLHHRLQSAPSSASRYLRMEGGTSVSMSIICNPTVERRRHCQSICIPCEIFRGSRRHYYHSSPP